VKHGQQNDSRKLSKSQEKDNMQVQEVFRTPNRHGQKRTSSQHIIVKIISTENKERILKAVREKSNNT
jgi:hypothetical protein